jgi:sirohydrochlorin ferrochelatase
MNARHLLLIAHGSRRQASNEEVLQLAERVRSLRAPSIDHVQTAFLELAEPSIKEGLARCAALGAREIVVFPYFLAAGTHVVNDIPAAVETFRAKRPDIQIRLTQHLGASDNLPQAILAVADPESASRTRERDVRDHARPGPNPGV